MKICKKCHKLKQSKYFYKYTNSGTRKKICKECELKISKKKRQERRKLLKEEKERKCRMCEKVKPIEEFSRLSKNHNSIKYLYRKKDCRECCNIKQRERYKSREDIMRKNKEGMIEGKLRCKICTIYLNKEEMYSKTVCNECAEKHPIRASWQLKEEFKGVGVDERQKGEYN